MGARTKLNSAYFVGSLALASVAGWLTGSWVVWLITLAILVGASVHDGAIRMDKRRR